MFTLYNLFKFLHIVAIIVWIGGVVMVGILNTRVARSGNRSAMAALGQQSAVLGKTLIGPAAGTALIAGIVTMLDGGIEFTSLWILWGLIAIFVSMFLGSGPINRAGEELAKRASDQPRHPLLRGVGHGVQAHFETERSVPRNRISRISRRFCHG